jgi:plastocyanin
MKRMSSASIFVVVFSAIVVVSCGKPADLDSEVAATPAARGTVRGHVHLTGDVPSREVIRMNADPMCVKASGGSHITDEAIIAAADGSLANVFVELVGTFPDTPVPSEPVSIDQRGCVYSPRVVGLRAGQALRVRNSDDGLHNVHGVSTDRDGFNVSQPVSGMVNTFRPRDAGILRLKCDVHTWMVAFVGVVNHPYFAVTAPDGTFTLRDVPEGTYEVRAWQEDLGTVVSHVHVEAAREANVEMTYSGTASGAIGRDQR